MFGLLELWLFGLLDFGICCLLDLLNCGCGVCELWEFGFVDLWICGFWGLFICFVVFVFLIVGGKVVHLDERSFIFQTKIPTVFDFGIPWSHLLAIWHTRFCN